MSKKPPFNRKKVFQNTSDRSMIDENYFAIGIFNGCGILVDDDSHMRKLYNEGYFGKGNLSRSIPNFKSNSIDTKENLNLTMEEAFFLCSVVGCLQVKLEDDFINVTNMWNVFQKASNRFLPCYIAYHHFRKAGWIVRSGIKFGSDFLLYKQGPDYYHASYSVQVSYMKSSKQTLNSWVELATVNRITEAVSKEYLLCSVTNNQEEIDLTVPDCIQHFNLNCVILKRWVSSEERFG